MWKLGLVGLGLAVAACGGSDGGNAGAPLASARGGSGSGGAAVAEDAGSLGAGGETVIAKPLCVPGQSVACVGPGACQGGQTCKADGSGYEACECAAMSEDAGPPSVTRAPDGYFWDCTTGLVNGEPLACDCKRIPNIGSAIGCGTRGPEKCQPGCMVSFCCQVSGDSCHCITSAGQTCDPGASNSVSCP
jgi:hypothetical protein